jgi:hypothetical protein
MKNGSCSATTLPGSTALPFVVSTGAYPDFLLQDAATTTYAVFLKKTAYVLINATNLDRKSGGAEWRDLRFSGHFLEVFFDRAKRRRRTCGFISWVPTHPLKPRWQSVDRFTTFSGRLNP